MWSRWTAARIEHRFGISPALREDHAVCAPTPRGRNSKQPSRDGLFISTGPATPRRWSCDQPIQRRFLDNIPTFGYLPSAINCWPGDRRPNLQTKIRHRGGIIREKSRTRPVEAASQNHALGGGGRQQRVWKKAGGVVPISDLNDNTVEVSDTKLPFFRVQYHPESSPPRPLHDCSIKFCSSPCLKNKISHM